MENVDSRFDRLNGEVQALGMALSAVAFALPAAALSRVRAELDAAEAEARATDAANQNSAVLVEARSEVITAYRTLFSSLPAQ